jgi:hypothetical protein
VWFPIAGTVHAGSAAAPTDVADDTATSTRRLAFCSIAVKDAQVVLAATGGHQDYAGNEVTGIDLAANAPAWALLSAGSAPNDVVADAPYYRDGLPSSRHTYNAVHYSTTRQRLMLHGTRFAYGNGRSYPPSNGFNMATGQWDPAGTWKDGMTALCRDAYDNCWSVLNYFQLWRWTPATDTWALTGRFGGAIYPALAHDWKRNLLFQLSWGNGEADGVGATAFKYTSNGRVQTALTIKPSAAYTQWLADTPSYASMAYDPDGDRFLYWDGNSQRLYQITPNDTNIWDMAIVATAGTLPPRQSGSYGRLAYIASLRGCVVMPSGHEPLYFIKVA